jgi:hypothetical protein
MCCASREPAQNFKQYIDVDTGSGKYIPITLDEHWNGEHMRSVRRRMMSGETLPECDVCNSKLLNTSVYRDYFWHLFKHKYQEAMDTTREDGSTDIKPISWDYRFSNLCNFKCRMCGDMLSSSWETEERQHNMIDWNNDQNNWLRPDVKRQITEFQDSVIEQEFAQAVEEHRIEEVYWVGGEPLMYEQHWRHMKRIIELGDGGKLYARYNTNLSRIDYRGINLYRDILCHVRDWQICASLDGTGPIGEYIRTGLDFENWRENFKQGVDIAHHPRQMRIDFTLTLPGLFEIENIQKLAEEFGVEILAKVVFAFTPEVVLSPMALPRHLVNRWSDDLSSRLPAGALRDVVANLKSRPTFEEQWPDWYQSQLVKGKKRMLHLESIRGGKLTLDTILQKDPEIYEWWKNIRAD